MTPPFKIGDRVVCVNSGYTDLAVGGVYIVRHISNRTGDIHDQFVSVSSDPFDLYHKSRFTLEQPATLPDDYPDSVEDYAHNKPHVVIAYGAGTLLVFLTFLVLLWLGWWVL